MRVGIVGYSAQKFDETKAADAIAFECSRLSINNSCQTTIVSGYTNLGVPKIAYQYAQFMGYKTIGIACSKATKYECFPCDRVHIIGDEWGAESEAFLASIDVLLRIGGGNQSKKECQRAKDLGIPVFELELEAIA